MARQLRIEYEGAFYHVMARGDRREAIVLSDVDRVDFLETMARACLRSGWRLHAWVLMSNHYHWLLETPRANLVDGMRWFQDTYTRRFTVRNRQWGHVFGGRYKAVILDPEDADGLYFQALLDYIHLNPVRAAMVDPGEGPGLLEYTWSSLSRGYANAPSRRAPWMVTEIGLGVKQCSDSVSGRQRFVRLLEERAREERRDAGMVDLENQTLQSTLRRGWYWGSEALKERLLEKRSGGATRNRDYRLSQQGRETVEQGAEKIAAEMLAGFGLGAGELRGLPGSDERKVRIAARLHEETTVSQGWIAQRLGMGSAGNVSQQLYRMRKEQGNEK